MAHWLGDEDSPVEDGPAGILPGGSGQVPTVDYRDALGRFASGITVVTSTSQGVPVGLTCQSFTSVSLDPPMILFCPSRSSRAWPLIQRSGGFCVNVLAHDQAAVSNTMASRGIDKFSRIDWSPSPETGSPVIAGALAHVDCTVEAVHEAGDHYVVLGRVHHVAVQRPESEALLFFRGSYASTGD